MEETEDNSWVFDSLVCFLNGPIWNAPLQSFVEEKSLIFEPNVGESDEYKKIYDEFKNLVDFMLGNFMEDIGITPEQFENACKEGKKHHLSFDHNLFEQIWAANDYDMFKKMMTRRNVELQLEALELIERKYGITPDSFVPKGKEGKFVKEKENEEKMEKVVREIPVVVVENEVLDEVARTFASEEEPAVDTLEVKNIIQEQRPNLEKFLQESTKNDSMEKTKKADATNEDQGEKSGSLQDKGKKDEQKPNEVDAIELKKRQEYLRAQRDKLVALKKEARRKQLNNADQQSSTASDESSRKRPKSAKAAERVLDGKKPSFETKELNIRKSLAEKLRAQVVSKDNKQ
ncbi:unnamed protein product [Acanthoscelides obtectus]|uniref:Cilia- and flagella-associated protein 36 n=1 Tax=Acanthoscelides obtectus TaxID=200917 RepID=A0A9P0PME2_ACAOB|nr:unnamed protein product [Acanthoscelides obtectus]CAK1637594.1 Cilia- and flagella-associated protein 36 [Acanthoscelides obtectus]